MYGSHVPVPLERAVQRQVSGIHEAEAVQRPSGAVQTVIKAGTESRGAADPLFQPFDVRIGNVPSALGQGVQDTGGAVGQADSPISILGRVGGVEPVLTIWGGAFHDA